MTEKYTPIETPLGILCGRDVFYLDEVKNDTNSSSLKIKGEISDDTDIPYQCCFEGVQIFKQIELDTWLESDTPNFMDTSSFYEVINSPYISDGKGKIDSSYKHIVLQTYDWVFIVVCKQYELLLGESS